MNVHTTKALETDCLLQRIGAYLPPFSLSCFRNVSSLNRIALHATLIKVLGDQASTMGERRCAIFNAAELKDSEIDHC